MFAKLRSWPPASVQKSFQWALEAWQKLSSLIQPATAPTYEGSSAHAAAVWAYLRRLQADVKPHGYVRGSAYCTKLRKIFHTCYY